MPCSCSDNLSSGDAAALDTAYACALGCDGSGSGSGSATTTTRRAPQTGVYACLEEKCTPSVRLCLDTHPTCGKTLSCVQTFIGREECPSYADCNTCFDGVSQEEVALVVKYLTCVTTCENTPYVPVSDVPVSDATNEAQSTTRAPPLTPLETCTRQCERRLDTCGGNADCGAAMNCFSNKLEQDVASCDQSKTSSGVTRAWTRNDWVGKG